MIGTIYHGLIGDSNTGVMTCMAGFAGWSFVHHSGDKVVLSVVFGLFVMWVFCDLARTESHIEAGKSGLGDMKFCSLGGRNDYRYVGNKRCKMCHARWYESWITHPHSRATAALRSGISRAYKTRVGLNPKMNYMSDTECLCCHTVGYGLPGGYRIPETGDRRSQRFARQREGVGCESCHGPGNGYTAVMSEIEDSFRNYKVKELRSKGLVKITASLCTSCHRPAAPCIERTYKFEARGLGGNSFHKSFNLNHRIR